MSQEDHKIDAKDRAIFDVLNERKYTVDYFQREYSWEQKHIEQLVTDLTSSFLEAYTSGDKRHAVERYNVYYLGPFVVSSKNGTKSIIDGQQRLTSLTLFLIYLNNLQKDFKTTESIESLIFSEKFGKKSFNIQVEERKECLEKLFYEGAYTIKNEDDASTVNMTLRYADISEAFPEELKGKPFAYFLDWLKYNVILVEITAYSDDNAYKIFESMNDRGLNLTSTEMLKGYILSRFIEEADRDKANRFWKNSVQRLQEYSKDEDQSFFQAWFRSQYADTIRQSKAGSSNEDFEKIGTRFHSWFRDNLAKAVLHADSPDDFTRILHVEMRFYLEAYCSILDAQKEEREGWEAVFYHSRWGIADSLAHSLMLAPLKSSDSSETTRQKINAVALYLETFAVRRSINFKKFGASSIRYTMYSLVKEIRGKTLSSLHSTLTTKLKDMPENWDGFADFRLHGMNRAFVKFLLARITGYIEQQTGSSSNFSTFYVSPGKKPYEVEHVWADKFSEHKNEFDQRHEFDAFRNRIGGLLLLPQGTNQSYGSLPYSDKLEHYLKENLLVKSLHPTAYKKNPNFLSMMSSLGLPFKAHKTFNKVDIDERQALMKAICESIWDAK